MKIHNNEKHETCYCFDNEENPLVKLLKFSNEEIKSITLSTNEIVFIMDGKIVCEPCDDPKEEFCKGQLIFLPAGDHLCCRVFNMTVVLVLRLTDSIHLCSNFNIKNLHSRMKEEEKPDSLYPLEINERLWHFAEGLIDTWQDGLKCKLYLRSEIAKLLNMLPLYYSKEDLSRFFYPILSPDTSFSEFVRKNHLKYPTVHELSDAIHMTTRQFTRRFHNVFGQAPYEWMQEQKAQLIYGEICHSNKPLKEIAAEYGFTEQANFNRFCKAFFETTPGRIRKNRP